MSALVVAAVASELGDLPGAALGVGPVTAAASMGRLLATERPDAVVLVGSAGIYPGHPYTPGAVFGVHTLGLGTGLAAVGAGYVPLAPAPLAADPDLLRRLPCPATSALTVTAITTDAALARQRGERWVLEHMECYAAACACAQAGVPFVAILGVSNQVGPDAHAQWHANRVAAQDAARAAARITLGLP